MSQFNFLVILVCLTCAKNMRQLLETKAMHYHAHVNL